MPEELTACPALGTTPPTCLNLLLESRGRGEGPVQLVLCLQMFSHMKQSGLLPLWNAFAVGWYGSGCRVRENTLKLLP